MDAPIEYSAEQEAAAVKIQARTRGMLTRKQKVTKTSKTSKTKKSKTTKQKKTTKHTKKSQITTRRSQVRQWRY